MDERGFSRLLAPYARRLGNMLARGVVSAVNAAKKMQSLQVRLLAGEVKDVVEHFEPYGFTAHPHAGAEAFAAFLDGDRSHGIVLVVADRRYRIKGLAAGEVAIYTDEDVPAGEHRIVMKRGQEIHLVAGASSIVMTPAGITITTPSLDIVKV